MKKCFILKFSGEHGLNEYTGTCVGCHQKIAKSHAERLAEEVAAIPRETKQRVLDLLHKGQTIGQAMEAVGLSLDAVCAIINENIKTAKYLASEAV